MLTKIAIISLLPKDVKSLSHDDIARQIRRLIESDPLGKSLAIEEITILDEHVELAATSSERLDSIQLTPPERPSDRECAPVVRKAFRQTEPHTRNPKLTWS